MMIGTLTLDGWAMTFIAFGTVKTGLGRQAPLSEPCYATLKRPANQSDITGYMEQVNKTIKPSICWRETDEMLSLSVQEWKLWRLLQTLKRVNATARHGKQCDVASQAAANKRRQVSANTTTICTPLRPRPNCARPHLGRSVIPGD